MKKSLSFEDVVKDWSLLADGASGSIILERAWLRKVQEVFRIFQEKQRGYGPKNIAVGGIPGLVFRISDKVSRLWELTGLSQGRLQEKNNVTESLRDSLIDIGDYGIIGMMVHDGDWPSTSSDEAFGLRGIVSAFSDLISALSPHERQKIAEYLLASEIALSIEGADLID